MDIKPIPSPTFGGINVLGVDNMPAAIHKAIKESPAINKFGKRYNADISYALMGSATNKNIIHPALIISNISPVTFFRKVIDKFRGIENNGDFLYLPTHGSKESDLSRKLTSVSENYLIKKYEDCFKKNT